MDLIATNFVNSSTRRFVKRQSNKLERRNMRLSILESANDNMTAEKAKAEGVAETIAIKNSPYPGFDGMFLFDRDFCKLGS